MKRTVEVTQFIEVEVDESKFTEQFMREFRESFYNFNTIEDHLAHLAQLLARGIADTWPTTFIEGYGPANEMGIKMRIIGQDEYVQIQRVPG